MIRIKHYRILLEKLSQNKKYTTEPIQMDKTSFC